MQDKLCQDDNTIQDLARDPMMVDSQREARGHTMRLLLGRYRTTMASSLEMLTAFQLQPKQISTNLHENSLNLYKPLLSSYTTFDKSILVTQNGP